MRIFFLQRKPGSRNQDRELVTQRLRWAATPPRRERPDSRLIANRGNESRGKLSNGSRESKEGQRPRQPQRSSFLCETYLRYLVLQDPLLRPLSKLEGIALLGCIWSLSTDQAHGTYVVVVT